MNKSTQFVKRMSEARIAVMALQRHKPKAVYILDFLTWNMKRNNAVTISLSTISEILGVSRSTVDKGIADLKRNKMLFSVRTGRSNTYYINPKVARITGGDTSFYKFNSAVILSNSEAKELAARIKANEESFNFDII